MTTQAVADVLDRAMSDAEFRAKLATSPAEALAAFDLTPEERASFVTGSVAAEKLEERMSKTDLSAGIAAKTGSPILKAPSQQGRKI